ncbi:formate--tetrahydrofolate ligase [Fundicoccus culcitae]|uniref:Formate--tetrahydrofolate ligase n=1 Tax=Fundicoccus culcitae TaxID=2969821 RepID=A0ABY5P569_9LACT|nr:formate--tetrahydrofolate ligase [Fundicoccus culcitae]UUX33573.1 formate--tetrahydrofolate ligase [Fundicoccus culcitae]
MTEFLTDAQIAQQAELKPITEIIDNLGLDQDMFELYGKYKAKLNIHGLKDQKADGKLILVTAISPTPAGEGKTTTSIGLGDGLNRIGKKAVIALREPSLGPVFGMKGGAAGGGYSQVVPMEDINLHFTGDFHAIGAANNLLAALIDNHIHHGNALNIDTRRIVWKRVVDMNDRQLRNIVDGLGGKANGVPREDSYEITVASEVMAILCLAKDITDLKERLSRIVIGYNYDSDPITAGDLKAQGAMAALLKEAIKPNLVQTLEHNPVFIHGGPFANIAHGCNSVIATETALKLGDYTVTEAGFGADLGAEKFIDIKGRELGRKPDAVVLVATIRALKMHGGLKKTELKGEDLVALEKGLPNLMKHIENIQTVYNLPLVVAINKFPTDTDAELALVTEKVNALGVEVSLSDVWAKGGEGAIDLAEKVVKIAEQPSQGTFVYEDDTTIKEKIEAIVTKVYGGNKVVYGAGVLTELKNIEANGYGNLPVCMAKTQYSFTDNPKVLGRPTDFEVDIRGVKLSAGAGFIVVLTGEMMTMPGLPKVPASEGIDLSEDGVISGLF